MNINIPPDGEEPNLFTDLEIKIPENESGYDYQQKLIKNYRDFTNNKDKDNILNPINYFDLGKDTWSFFPPDSDLKKKITNSKNIFINSLDAIDVNQYDKVKKDVLISKLLEYIKVTFPKTSLNIYIDSEYYPQKLISKSNLNKDKAYDYFLCYSLSEIFQVNIEDNIDSLINNITSSVKTDKIIQRIKLFLNKYYNF